MNGHLQGHRRCSESWTRGGEHVALKALLKRAWKAYLVQFGMEESECPIEGLFGEPEAAE